MGKLSTKVEPRPGNDRTLTHVMEYLDRSHVPVTWSLADDYTSCDRYFCSVMGPTWPNRMFWFAGDSGGLKTNDFPTSGFTWPSIFHRLDDKGVPWRLTKRPRRRAAASCRR